MTKNILKAGVILLGILGVWLIYWDVADFMTTGINTGLWDLAILTNGLPSIIVGAIIVIITFYYGVKVLI